MGARLRLALLALGLLLVLAPPVAGQGLVQAVGPIGMTVGDMDRSVAFYARVLGFEKVSDVERWGHDWERLQGVFGLRMRVVGMRLGDEAIELTEYLAPRGRPVPADTRSHDRWFQHIAIIVSDMDRAYARLREHRVEHASPAPQRLPDWNPSAGGIRAFSSRTPTATRWRSCGSRPARETRAGNGLTTGCSWASTTRPSWWPTPSGVWPAIETRWVYGWWARATITGRSKSA